MISLITFHFSIPFVKALIFQKSSQTFRHLSWKYRGVEENFAITSYVCSKIKNTKKRKEKKRKSFMLESYL